MNQFIETYFNNLFKEIINFIKEVEQEQKKLNDNINKCLKECELFKMAIENYLIFLPRIEEKTQFNKNDLYKEITEKYKIFDDLIIKMKDNIEYIEKRNKNINLKYNDFINYDFFSNSSVNVSVNINNSNQSNSSNYKVKTPSFIEPFFNEKSNCESLSKNNEGYKCSTCHKQKATVFSKKQKIFFCASCFNNFIDNNNDNIHFDSDIISIENMTIKNNDKIKSFIKSIDFLLKNIIMRCDYILNNKELVSIMDEDNQIKVLDYPNIKNENKDCLDFVNKIYRISHDIKNKSFNLSNLNDSIIAIVRDINGPISINNQSISNQNINNQNIIDQDLDNVDDKFDSDDESFNEKYVRNESLKIGQGKYKYFCISVNSIINSNSEIELKNKLSKILVQNFSVINNEDIFISFNDNNRNIFVDNFIKTEKILHLSSEDIKKLYPNLEELYEYKNIFDSLIKECNIINYIDYRGNFIIQNMKKSIEKYYPPYEWIGIGLKVLGKYENDNWLTEDSKNNDWAVAYHGVGGKLSIAQVKNKLEKKIKEGLKQGKSQRHCNLYDYRHPGKRIGTGVYLSSNINKVEDFSGIILLNKKKYRVALMAKVKIDKIRQAINSNTWVLNPKYIRIYRILLKKI